MYTAEDILEQKNVRLINVAPTATVAEALNTMLENKIGAILVMDDDDILGIWTERDLMRNVMEEGFDVNTAVISDYMTKDLLSAPHDSHLYSLLDIFLGKRLRHLLIKKDGKYIGILSTGDVIKTNLNKKTAELDALNAKYNWDYYENWKLKKK